MDFVTVFILCFELIITLILYANCRHLKKKVTKCYELIKTYEKQIKESEERIRYLEREREERERVRVEKTFTTCQRC